MWDGAKPKQLFADFRNIVLPPGAEKYDMPDQDRLR
jgi:hypothetical protein